MWGALALRIVFGLIEPGERVAVVGAPTQVDHVWRYLTWIGKDEELDWHPTAVLADPFVGGEVFSLCCETDGPEIAIALANTDCVKGSAITPLSFGRSLFLCWRSLLGNTGFQQT